MPEQPPAYSLCDAARMLRRSERTLWSLVQTGRIRATKHGRAWQLDAASVVEFARANGIRMEGDDPRAELPPVPPSAAPAAPSGTVFAPPARARKRAGTA